VLGWPRSAVVIRALGASAGRVTGVRLLGHDGELRWTQRPEGLEISLPDRPPSDHAVAFAVSGLLAAGGTPEAR
jgi:alpha-L-fucosidase